MSMPFYVAPEQVMRDRADYARKNIARGRPLVASIYADGVMMAAENINRRLRKISEIYDRIAFAGVGKFNELDQLRVAGVRHADTKGFTYSREDVDARSLANVYAAYLGQVFTHEMKPMEVEIIVAELGYESGQDSLYHISFDGVMVDADRYVALGAGDEAISERMDQGFDPADDLATALGKALAALNGPERTIERADLEVAVLSRGNGRRAFRRVHGEELDSLLD
jgi:proteasome alpha subunit